MPEYCGSCQKFLLKQWDSPLIQGTFLPNFVTAIDWSLLSFPSMSLLKLLCLCHSTVWDFLLFVLLQCINVLQHSLWKAALEEWGWQLLGTTLQRGFSSCSGQVDSTCTSSETPSSPLGCCILKHNQLASGRVRHLVGAGLRCLAEWSQWILHCDAVGSLSSCTTWLLIAPLSFL